MLRFNANLYRIAMQCSSKEETRYYLQGVSVEPHAVKGVTLTTTDGHRLIAIHDEAGQADETAIIRLSPEALKACKPGKGDDRRIVTVDGPAATVHAFTSTAEDEIGEAIAISAKCRIDGSFPDWRRVVPQSPMVLEDGATFAHFSGDYLASMGAVGVELEKHFDRYSLNPGAGRGVTKALITEPTSPALILWDKVPEAFGVLMPVRGGDAFKVPAWLNAKPETIATEETPAPVLEAAE